MIVSDSGLVVRECSRKVNVKPSVGVVCVL